MSGCDLGAVEAYAFGEIEGESAARMRAHLGACEACAGELSLLRAERRALSAYGRGAPRPLPAFEAVLARSLAGEGQEVLPARPTTVPVRAEAGGRGAGGVGGLAALFARLRAAFAPSAEGAPRFPPAWVGLGAFAGATALVLQFLPAVSSPVLFLSDDPGGLACRLEEPARFENAVASAEDAFRACLMVTPTYAPPALVDSDGAPNLERFRGRPGPRRNRSKLAAVSPRGVTTAGLPSNRRNDAGALRAGE